MVRADLGLAPWDVLHQGVSERTGISIGVVTILTGIVVLLLWIPIRERPGLGTVLNVLVIGVVVDVTLAVVDAPEAMWQRVGLLVVGVYVFGPGSGWYIGAGLGPGPRDGLMTGIARRGHSRARRAHRHRARRRSCIGVPARRLASASARCSSPLTVGPNVHWHLDRMTMPEARPRTTALDEPPATSRRCSQRSRTCGQHRPTRSTSAAGWSPPAPTREPAAEIDQTGRHRPQV